MIVQIALDKRNKYPALRKSSKILRNNTRVGICRDTCPLKLRFHKESNEQRSNVSYFIVTEFWQVHTITKA